MIRRMVIGLVIITGMVQFADAQRLSQASQVVTFSVRTTNHTLVAGATDTAIPADLKVTATFGSQSNDTAESAIDIRSTNQLKGLSYASVSGNDNHSNALEGAIQPASRTVIFTVTQ